MTYYKDNDGVGVPELRMNVDGDDNGVRGDYVKLRDSFEVEENEEVVVGLNGVGGGEGDEEEEFRFFHWRLRWSAVWRWTKMALVFASIGLMGLLFLKYVAPFIMDKGVIPFIKWEKATFSKPVLALLLIASLAIFPVLFIPSSPSMWVIGMLFGYGFGFLLILPGVLLGMSLPYFIGSLFRHKIQLWLDKYPKRAATLRAAGAGDWHHQFRAVVLIRLSPFPYILYNYCAVATQVSYGPYIMGSLVGVLPDIFLSIYTGILIQTFGDSSHEGSRLSASLPGFNAIGFCAVMASAIIFTVLAKRQLKVLQEPLLV